jgi:hypothetical protein
MITRCVPVPSSRWICKSPFTLDPLLDRADRHTSSGSPISWIVGATFLKNVYSVYRYNPPAVGFAQLSGSAGTVSNGTSVTGSPTTAGGTAGSGGTGSKSGAMGQVTVAGMGIMSVLVGSLIAALVQVV